MEQVQTASAPAIIFLSFYNGKFVTTDLSICKASRFAKILGLSPGLVYDLAFEIILIIHTQKCEWCRRFEFAGSIAIISFPVSDG